MVRFCRIKRELDGGTLGCKTRSLSVCVVCKFMMNSNNGVVRWSGALQSVRWYFPILITSLQQSSASNSIDALAAYFITMIPFCCSYHWFDILYVRPFVFFSQIWIWIPRNRMTKIELRPSLKNKQTALQKLSFSESRWIIRSWQRSTRIRWMIIRI